MPARSVVQRRLFALAHLYKNGRLEGVTVSDEIKKLAKLPDSELLKFASTNQKKRNKDGAVSKRNAIPYRVKKHKRNKRSEKNEN